MDLLTQYSINVILFLIILVWTWFQYFQRRERAANYKLAPGPYPFPIIGNLLQLSGARQTPHRTFAHLSKTYGPLMSLRLGRIYTVVVSSPSMAKEILQKNDLAFSSRPVPASVHVLDIPNMSMVFSPATGNHWRQIRKLTKEQMFSTLRLDASEGLRQEKLQKLRDYVRGCCQEGRAVNIGEAAFTTMLNLLSATLFSTEVAPFDSDEAKEIRSTLESVTTLAGAPNIADFFPILKPFDPQGIRRKSRIWIGKLLDFIEDLISQRIMLQQSSGSTSTEIIRNDMLGKLLELHRQGGEYEFLSVNVIKHLLQDLFAGGADTTPSTVEWAMTELLLNPNKLSKAKQEIMAYVQGEKKQLVEESDISRLPYLQAVIKETFRLHPPGPFLIPRKSEYDVQVSGGYTIPKGTQMIVNAWQMGKDPNIWMDPDSFEPERFLDSPIDFKGQYFELIPFGSGRRICPGLPLANRMLHIMMATLIHNFDWKLDEAGDEAKATHKAEMFGVALRRAVPLMAIPIMPLS